MGQRGIENTKEVVELAGEIGVQVVTLMRRPGFQPKDLLTIFEQPAVIERVRKAVDGIAEVPAEVTDIDPIEAFVLGREALGAAQRIVQALRAA